MRFLSTNLLKSIIRNLPKFATPKAIKQIGSIFSALILLIQFFGYIFEIIDEFK